MSAIEIEPQRTHIREQAGSPTVCFTIDDTRIILPYSYFLRAECHTRSEDRFLVIAHWSGGKITIEGVHLENLVQLLTEYRLDSVTLRTSIERAPDLNWPHIERILVDFEENKEPRGKPKRKKRTILAESVGHP